MGVIRLTTDQILIGICTFVFTGILTAGLWPFHTPRNNVTWLPDGLGFAKYGTAVSAGDFPTSTTSPEHTIEIWIEPARTKDFSTILAFYNPGQAQQLSLHQIDDALALQTSQTSGRDAPDPTKLAYLPRFFRQRTPVFITIATGLDGASVYVNGEAVKQFPRFQPDAQAFAGRLILATSPVVNDSWPGLFRGLALYESKLSPDQITSHYQSWLAKGEPDISAGERPVAVYSFREGRGGTVHNDASIGQSNALNLAIPNYYSIVDEKFLEPFWREFHWDWGFWKNVLINIGGFVPLGFCFDAYFRSKRMKRPGLVAIVLGAAVSLTIEVLQSSLPTRDSGTTDLITNTLGTVLGVLLFSWKPLLLVQTLDFLPFLERVE